jgi:formate hydrogenlyase subunit 3/multisubunit Na+/H+ antiporter MnhD subunit
VSLTLLFGILTLAPAVAAILVLALGLARRPLSVAVLALAALGVLVPFVALIALSPDLSFAAPLRVSLLGGSVADGFTPVLRADALGLYAAFGVTILVAPLLIWIATYASPPAALITTAEESAAEEAEERSGPLSSVLAGGQWASVALVLGLESALLMLCFADNVAWMVLCWIVVALLAWALGEVGSEFATLDYVGLGFTLLGPVLWLIAMLFVVNTGHAPALLDLTGAGTVTFWQSVLIAIALGAAGGGYPFLAWLRRRAAFATPAGLAATVVGVIPAALFVGARTYGALASQGGLWPIIGVANPPITAGIAFVLLGALSVATSGLLALGRRDVRSLIALLAAAQTGWGLLAIGLEHPASVGALVLLLATTVLGMGALLGSAIAGGMIAADEEPEGAGPRPYDRPLRVLPLIAWGLGVVTLLGVPLFAGFTVRELLTAGALQGAKLDIPLVGLAWIGEALLALALLRAAAPALTYTAADEEPDASEEAPERANGWREYLPALPGALFAALGLLLGIVPQAFFGLGANLAAADLLQPNRFARDVRVTTTGFILPTGQWLPSIAWALVLVLIVVFALLQMLRPRAAHPAESPEAEEIAVDGVVADEDELAETASPMSPAEAWDQLRPVFASEWLQPGTSLLLDGTDDEADDGEAAEEVSDQDAADAEVAEDPERDQPEEQEQPDDVARATGRRKQSKHAEDDGV